MHICLRQAVSTEELLVGRGIDTQVSPPVASTLRFPSPGGDIERTPN